MMKMNLKTYSWF